VKFNGEMFVAGMYVDKTTLKKDTTTDGPSTAFYYQRLRLGTEFVVTPGISVVTRADIMERILGGARSATSTTNDSDSNGSRMENENIAFDMAYIKAATPFGLLQAGYIPFGTWGTEFNNSGPKGVPGVSLFIPVGDVLFAGYIFKIADTSYSTVTSATTGSDVDYDLYLVFARYAKKNIEAGLLLSYLRSATTTKAALNYTKDGYGAVPYFKATFGPVYLEGELLVGGGKAKRYENSTLGTDIDSNPLAFYLSGTVKLGPAYVGGTFAYWAGDDPAETTRTKYDAINLGPEWSPSLIMWNRDRSYNFGAVNGHNSGTIGVGGYANTTGFGSSFQNAFFWQARAGVKPTDKMDICLSISKSDADQNPIAGWVSKDMGWEVDLTAKYNITNNLSYMLGGGYLLAGDYFKGTNSANQIRNEYLVINKLALTF